MGDEQGAHDDPPKCHCRAGRLVMIVGEATNDAIAQTRQWAANKLKTNHVHKVFFEAKHDSSFLLASPHVPDGKGGWKAEPKGQEKDPLTNFVATEFHDCCHFEEVVIFAHGHQTALYSSLADELPKLIDRPVVKLVFWVCGGDRDNYPFTDSGRHRDFLRICQLVRPPAGEHCACGCNHANCHLQNADGQLAGKCPDEKDKTVVLSAGYYKSGGTQPDGKVLPPTTVPSSLGLKPDDPAPFGAPDGLLIRTEVSRGAGEEIDTTSTSVTGEKVLGTPVRSDDDLKNPNPGGYGFDPNAKIGPAKRTEKPQTQQGPYRGPKVTTACPHDDGCFAGR